MDATMGENQAFHSIIDVSLAVQFPIESVTTHVSVEVEANPMFIVPKMTVDVELGDCITNVPFPSEIDH
jgi:hypothetical protein